MLRRVLVLLVVAGCTQAAPVPSDPPVVGLSNAPVTVDGQTFMAAIGPGPQGVALIAAGGVPVPGRQVTITGGLTQSDGVLARRAAVQACADGRSGFNAGALGRFDGAAWIFDGGCA
jgi:hypothetical protein